MRFSELPKSDALVTSSHLTELSNAISKAIGSGVQLTGPEPVEASTSHWLYRAMPSNSRGGFTPSAVATALMAFSEDCSAVFPRQKPGSGKIWGWEIRKGELDGVIIVTAIATLVDTLAHA